MPVNYRAANICGLFAEAADEGGVAERADRRRRLFRETAGQRAHRHLAALVALARNGGWRRASAAMAFLARERAMAAQGLPNPRDATADGLCGLIDAVSPSALMAGYERGLVMSVDFGGLTWRSPRDRFVRSMSAPQKPVTMRRDDLSASIDRRFDAVVAACARASGAFNARRYTPQALHLFAALFDAGYAHSFEVVDASGAIIAGGFGLAVGDAFVTHGFFGDDDAIGFGLGGFHQHLRRLGLRRHDALEDSRAARWGFASISRADYLAQIAHERGSSERARWSATDAQAA